MIQIGDRFVGERAAREKAESARERRFARGLPVDRFEDPDHLIQYHDDLMAAEARDSARSAALRAYINFWAGEKRKLIERHRARGCYEQCDSCLLCLRCKDRPNETWNCTCTNGTKMLSPYRFVWLNGSIKRDWMSSIWKVGEGFVPREVQADKFSLGAHGLDELVS